jgi:deoxycytidylate deaminase
MRSGIDALYKIKRGFLIVGFTGYTASGFTSAAKIFLQNKKPKLPKFTDIFSNEDVDQNSYTFDSILKELRYRKLKKTWDKLTWEPFTYISVSRVIFCLAIHDIILNNLNIKIMSSAIQNVKKKPYIQEALTLFKSTGTIDKDIAKKLIKSYEACEAIFTEFKKDLGTVEYIINMQRFGDEIRNYGRILPSSTHSPSADNLSIIANSLRRLIKSYRVAKNRRYFVIDAFRNPYEVEYFKRRYNEFYLFVVSKSWESRNRALLRIGFTQQQIDNDVKDREEGFASQNIEDCIVKADIFIESRKRLAKRFFRYHIIKFLALYQKPGCIQPSNDERSMQIAVTARQMSGCISRQVGAVVCDHDAYILGVGWNDPPFDQIPCSLREGEDLISGQRPEIFSEFEKSKRFTSHIKNCSPNALPFCFREQLSELETNEKQAKDRRKYYKHKKAEYTRALHAEENALSQATKNTGSFKNNAALYSTTSTCTLCAKKAYQLGIKRIVYIEEYPGIALEQTVRTGLRKIRLEKFEGIVGSAYFKLFTSFLPEKEIIELERG